MTFFSSERRSGRGPGFAPGLVIAVWLISALMTPPHADSKANSQDGGGSVTTVSAASYAPVVSPDSIVAAFGSGLATQTAQATAKPLPTNLAGTTVRVNGALAPLFFVSPGQVNYLTPPGIPPGVASVVVTSGDGVVSTGSVQIAPVAPALFTANSDAQGALSSQLLRIKADNRQIYESLAQYDGTRFVTRPIDFGEESDQLFLVIYLTGIRHAPPSGVRVSLGGVEYSALYSGAQGNLDGLDQVNVALPRNFGGRGKISLLVKSDGYGASNAGEFEIGAGTQSQGTLQITGPTQAVLAGEEFEISGSGFAANPRENSAQIVADDGVTAKADVLAVSGSTMRIRTPFGAGTGKLKVSRGQIEASADIRLRTSVSGFIERAVSQDGQIVRTPIPGARIRLNGRPETERATDAEGSFVMPDMEPGPKVEFEILPPANGSLNFPNKKFALRVREGRDNQIPRGDEQTVISDSPFPLLAGSDAASAESKANAAAANPDQNLTLTYLEPGRTPANLPVGHFSTRIAQVAPFGRPISPGAKLSFPNADAIPVGTTAKLFKFDQTDGSATLGQFGEIGPATVTSDGQRVETAANAITEGSYYFVSIARPTATISGRVVERDGRPAPRAIVQARGQSTFTDGFGGFVLNNVPVIKASGDRVRVEVSYQRPDGRVSRKDSGEVELTEGALVTIKPDIALDPAAANFPPVILAPSSLTLNAGETREFDLVATDPDNTQAPEVSLSGSATTFTTLSDQGAGVYRLRLAPAANAAGNYTLTLKAADNEANVTQTIAITVTQASNNAPAAQGQAVTTPEDTPGAITLSGSDPGGRSLSYAIVAGPSRGSLSGAAPNLVYTPAPNFNGVDSFTFKASNGSAESQPATVFIAVSPVNDAPVLDVPGTQAVKAGETLNLVVSARDADGDQALRFTATDLPPGATFTDAGGTSRLLSWTPTFAQAGAYQVKITVTDDGRPPLSASGTAPLIVSGSWAKTSGPEGARVNVIHRAGANVYIGTAGSGVQRSTDNGLSWTDASSGLLNVNANSQNLDIRGLATIGPTLFAATDGGGVYRSTDNGRNWTESNAGMGRVQTTSLVTDGTALFTGTPFYGVYRSTDGGRNWTQSSSGLDDLFVLSLAVKGTNIFAGTFGGRVFRSTDKGANWTDTGLAATRVSALAASGIYLFAGSERGVFRSADDGQSWGAINSTLRVESLAASGATIFAGTRGGLYRSTDIGQSWSTVNPALQGYSVVGLSVDGETVFAGERSIGKGVYRSTDNGQSWIEVNAGLTNTRVFSLTASGGAIFAGTGGGFDGSGGIVYRSTLNGQSWTDVFLPNTTINALAGSGATIFAGTQYSGLYRSTDSGQSWAPANTGLDAPLRIITSLVVSGSTIFAGTVNNVYRSTNNGLSWTPAASGLGRFVISLAVSGTTIFAGTGDGGVYRLTNNGQSWTQINTGLTDLSVRTIAVKGTTLFAGTSFGGVFRSSDNGDSWTEVNSGLTDKYIRSIVVVGGSLFASTGENVFISTNDGQSWTEFNTGLTNRIAWTLAVDGPRLFAGTYGQGVFLLADNAQTWIGMNANLTNRNLNSIVTSGSQLYAGTLGGGVFRSTDQGQSWSPVVDGLPPNANIQSLVTSGATIWAAAFGEGVYASNDQGRSWRSVNSGLTNKLINNLFLNGATLYAGTDGGVFRSTNGGNSWTALNTGLINLRALSFTIANGTLYAGTDGGGVFRLNPDGAGWTQVNRGLTSQSVAVLGVKGGALYAGTVRGGVCISRDGGENWTAVNNGLPANLSVFAFASSGRKVYLGCVYGVFVTEDEGQTWKQINAGLLDTFVTGLAVSGDQLFTSTASGGVFVSRIP
ncbi:MAG: Ig-like domain-containing protein [Acidobacteria bacterium]|nr:Ig-like domain-containing protein [Acidobacteriota bacterium]